MSSVSRRVRRLREYTRHLKPLRFHAVTRWNERGSPSPKVVKPCARCVEPSPQPLSKGRPKKYCSIKCRQAACEAYRIEQVCQACGGKFTAKAGRKFCSVGLALAERGNGPCR